MNERLTLDQALMELNDRLNREVEVTIGLDLGDYTVVPMNARGRLRFRRAALAARDDRAGLYDVGSANFEVTDLSEATLLSHPGGTPWGVRFKLADDVSLEVSWGTEGAV